ncbi:hypothetical protein [Bradyrhizobium sp. BR 1432]|uniref:hypothetical protein n=1 Tax=Bradyrhizobium sp. BR 1432 TaxID=3447966 RepID=UPI003EE49F05
MTGLAIVSLTVASSFRMTLESSVSAFNIAVMRSSLACASARWLRAAVSEVLISASCCSVSSRPPASTMLFLALKSATVRSAEDACDRNSFNRSCSQTAARLEA